MIDTQALHPEICAIIDRCRDTSAKSFTIFLPETAADRILAAGGWEDAMPVPVQDIAEAFGFKVYTHRDIPGRAAGCLYIGGTTKSLYRTDRIILVSPDETLERQRFAIAHGIGCFLETYLGSEWEGTPEKVFAMPCGRTEGERDGIMRAGAAAFADRLLMLRGRFSARYLAAMESLIYDKNYAVPVLAGNFCVEAECVERRITEIIFYEKNRT